MATNSGLTPGGASYPLLTDAPHPDNIKEPVVELDQRALVIAADVAALNSILDEEDRTNRLGFLTNTRELVAWDGSNWLNIGSPRFESKRVSSESNHSVTGTSFGTLASLSVEIDCAVKTDALITIGASSARATSNIDLHGRANLSGATSGAAANCLVSSGFWTPVSKPELIELNAGKTTITFEARVSANTGTNQFNQPFLQVTPA